MLTTCLGDATWGLVLGAKNQPVYEYRVTPNLIIWDKLVNPSQVLSLAVTYYGHNGGPAQNLPSLYLENLNPPPMDDQNDHHP